MRGNTGIDVASLNSDEIEVKMKELCKKIDGVWNCMACDCKAGGKSSDIRKHVETHIDGLCYTCNICSKEFRLRRNLNHHKNTSHKQ